MYPILVTLGTFELRTYGVVVALSFLLGLWLSTTEARRKGIDPGLIQDFAFYAFLGGIIGARIYFVVFSRQTHQSWQGAYRHCARGRGLRIMLPALPGGIRTGA